MEASPAKEDFLRRLFRLFNSGQREGILEAAVPETEIHSPITELQGGPYRGRAGVEEWFAEIDEQFSDFQIELGDVRELDGGTMLLGVKVEMRGRRSELPFSQDFTYLMTVEGEKLLGMRIFVDRDKALEAAGQAPAEDD